MYVEKNRQVNFVIQKILTEKGEYDYKFIDVRTKQMFNINKNQFEQYSKYIDILKELTKNVVVQNLNM